MSCGCSPFRLSFLPYRVTRADGEAFILNACCEAEAERQWAWHDCNHGHANYRIEFDAERAERNLALFLAYRATQQMPATLTWFRDVAAKCRLSVDAARQGEEWIVRRMETPGRTR